MQFELFRLALLERPQFDIEEARPGGQRPQREAWLRGILAEEITFIHRKEQFHYVPDKDAPVLLPIIVGRIGRKTAVHEHEPPEQGLADKVRDVWVAARVLIDPVHHPDGQKLALEHEFSVGMPFALASSLVESINSRVHPYEIEISPIVDAETFWEFVNKHRGEVTSVTFEFVAPNMFGEKDDYAREIRELKEKEKVRRAKLQLENRDGLELNTPKVERAVEYISPGQGVIRAKTKRKQTFKSERKVKRVSIDKKQLNEIPTEALIGTLIERIFKT